MTGRALPPDGRALARSLYALLVAEHALERKPRFVVAIAGESGSGKTVTASALADELRAHGHHAVVLHQDDYFIRPPRANHEHRCADLASVGPHEVNLTLLDRHVADFRAGREGIEAPLSDYRTDSFLVRRLDFADAAVLVIEGTYVLQLDDSDIRIFMEATHEETAERRRLRNRDVDAPIIDDILAIEHALIAPQVRRADIVIDREFTARR